MTVRIIALIASDKNRKSSFSCPRISACDRRIKHMKSPFCSFFIQLFGNLRTRGRHIDQICTFFRTVQNISAVEIYFFYILRKSYDRNHCLAVFYALGNRFMKDRSFPDHVLDFCFCPGINMKFIPCFHKITHHGFSHDPHTDKSDLLHLFFPFPLICRYFYDTSVFIHIGLSVLPVLIFFYDFAFVFINTVCRNKSSYRRG